MCQADAPPVDPSSNVQPTAAPCTFLSNGNPAQLDANGNCVSVWLGQSCTTSSGGTGTINISTNNVTVNGDLYAPNGYISCSSNNVHQGYWVARKISVSCNNFELDGIPGRASGGTAVSLVE